METIIARQPIFNLHKRLFAYELLYPGTKKLSLQNIGGERATTSLLTSAFLTEGVERATILERLPITEEIKLALVSESGPLSSFFKTIEVAKEDIHTLYLDAVAYADNLTSA